MLYLLKNTNWVVASKNIIKSLNGLRKKKIRIVEMRAA